MLLDIELPWPPSVNHMYVWSNNPGFKRSGKARRGGKIRTERAKEFEQSVSIVVNLDKVEKIGREKRLSMKIWLWPPDRRKRDIDNTAKSILDSISRSLGFDDSQIDELYIARMNVAKGGKVHVQIKALGEKPVCGITKYKKKARV